MSNNDIVINRQFVNDIRKIIDNGIATASTAVAKPLFLLIGISANVSLKKNKPVLLVLNMERRLFLLWRKNFG